MPWQCAPSQTQPCGYLGVLSGSACFRADHDTTSVISRSADESVAWSLFWLLQLATLLRIAASVPGRLSAALLLGAALLWAAVVAVWGVRLGSWYGRLRPDGRPG